MIITFMGNSVWLYCSIPFVPAAIILFLLSFLSVWFVNSCWHVLFMCNLIEYFIVLIFVFSFILISLLRYLFSTYLPVVFLFLRVSYFLWHMLSLNIIILGILLFLFLFFYCELFIFIWCIAVFYLLIYLIFQTF